MLNEQKFHFGILAYILIGSSSDLFLIENSFAEEDLSVSPADSKAYQKQLDIARN